MKPLVDEITHCGKIILLAAAVTFPVRAQNTPDEYQFWPSAAIGKTFQNGIKLDLEQRLRLAGRQLDFSETATEFRIGADIPGNITITGYYRHISYSNGTAQRIALSYTTLSVYGRTAASFRIKVQRQQYEDFEPVDYLRLLGQYSLILPYLDLRPFIQLEPWLILSSELDWTRYRFTIGAQYDLSQRFTGDLFYRYQGDGQGEYWSGTHILGLKLGIEF